MNKQVYLYITETLVLRMFQASVTEPDNLYCIKCRK